MTERQTKGFVELKLKLLMFPAELKLNRRRSAVRFQPPHESVRPLSQHDGLFNFVCVTKSARFFF